jgi:hypothetical protein
VLGYGAVTVIDQGHRAVGTQWRAAVVIGGGASIGLLALIAAVLAVARWRPRASRALFPVAMALVGALALIAWAGLHMAGDSGPVTSPWQVGLAAAFVPVAFLAMVVLPLLTWRRRSPGGAGAGPGMRDRCQHQRARRRLVGRLDRHRPAAQDAASADPDQRSGRRRSRA